MRDTCKFDMIKIATRHFESKMQNRNVSLNTKIRQSKQGTLPIQKCAWKDEYEKIMSECWTTVARKKQKTDK